MLEIIKGGDRWNMLEIKRGRKELQIEKEEVDEFEIPTLVLIKTPSQEEMEKRKKISSLRKQYGIRFDEIGTSY